MDPFHPNYLNSLVQNHISNSMECIDQYRIEIVRLNMHLENNNKSTNQQKQET